MRRSEDSVICEEMSHLSVAGAAAAAPGHDTEKSLSVQESLSEISESDVAKFPALFGLRQMIKSDPQEARTQLSEVGQNVAANIGRHRFN